MNSIVWLGTSKDDVRAFPDGTRRQAGFQLDKVQNGQEPDDWKPMTTVGMGVREIRLRDGAGAFRILYLVKFGNTIYVLHAFQKKTQRTRIGDIELAKERLRMISR